MRTKSKIFTLRTFFCLFCKGQKTDCSNTANIIIDKRFITPETNFMGFCSPQEQILHDLDYIKD